MKLFLLYCTDVHTQTFFPVLMGVYMKSVAQQPQNLCIISTKLLQVIPYTLFILCPTSMLARSARYY